MSHWKRLSRKHRALYLAIAVLALAATALASSKLTLKAEQEEPGELDAAMPVPADIFIQKTEEFPELGNVRVTVQLTPEQVAAKEEDGTVLFVTVGEFGNQVLFRDDGESGDAEAGDALYTAVMRIEEQELEERAQADREVLESGSGETPLFNGRALGGSQGQSAFDIDGFHGGEAVRLSRPSVDVGPVGPIGPVDPPPPLEPDDPPSEFQEKVLMIRDPRVVEDPSYTINPCYQDWTVGTPGGAWTFEHLMKEMANQSGTGINPSSFTEKWLKKWTVNQTINTFPVPSRADMQLIIDSWRAASGGGQLDLSKAPFRLLAIVPRLDLRELRAGSGGGSGAFENAGELRFIFGLVLPGGWTLPARLRRGYGGTGLPDLGEGCLALPFTVIFEYKVPISDCGEVSSWARQWVNLNGYNLGTAAGLAAYNARLAQLTERVVKANASPTRPNGSAIGQIRTNEDALQVPWELREFQLPFLLTSQIHETTTADTPHDSFNNQPLFQSWILSDVASWLSGPGWNQDITPVPDTYLSTRFKGANPEMPTTSFFWNAPGLNLAPNGGDNAENWGRHRASLATCNGCHAFETRTKFVHVDPLTPAGQPARLSRFLTGITVSDPANGAPVRSFDDLVRREQDIRALARTLCLESAGYDHAEIVGTIRANGRLPLSSDSGIFLSVPVDDLRFQRVIEAH